MARSISGKLAAQVRLDAKQQAMQQALTVPWRRLEQAASTYVDWHIFVLWVRSITEVQEQLPDMVTTALAERCPGFRDQLGLITQRQPFLWRELEEWIAEHEFADSRRAGWFDVVMYYAYKDLRTEQAWTLWDRTTEAWTRRPPPKWPTFEEWTTQVRATKTLSQPGTEKARAVQALFHVESERLRRAVAEVIEARAFALWAACLAELQQPLREPALSAIHSRYPRLLPKGPPPAWTLPIFLRLVRSGEAVWRESAREEGWYAALRYHVIHHPRYHRLVHYNQWCCAEWAQEHSRFYPTFHEWLAAGDVYCLARQD